MWPNVIKVFISVVITASLTFGITEARATSKLHSDVAKVHEDTQVILERMSAYDKRLQSLESGGSPPLLRHIGTDDERVAQLSTRLVETRADFSQRVANITSLLEKLIQQQTELIAYLKAKETKP